MKSVWGQHACVWRVHVNWLAVTSMFLVVPTACVGNRLRHQWGGEVCPRCTGWWVGVRLDTCAPGCSWVGEGCAGMRQGAPVGPYEGGL